VTGAVTPGAHPAFESGRSARGRGGSDDDEGKRDDRGRGDEDDEDDGDPREEIAMAIQIEMKLETAARRTRMATGTRTNHATDHRDDGWDARECVAETPSRFDRGGSWVDALVTLVATVLFGLSWTLVELERAVPFENGYAGAASWEQTAAPFPRTNGDVPSPWTTLAQRTSKR
jgi:hypothetical protein